MSTEPPEPSDSPEPPDLLLSGRYRLSRLIGEGGMGRVWEGVDELLDRPVAIKELTINEHLPPREIEVMRARMLREARSAAQLSHPSIITVFDVVEKDGFPWIVMELVRGQSLSEIIKEQGSISPERAANIGLQVAAGLAVAHQRGIVHRDIKPGNVLVAKGDRAVLTDFGIARLEGSSRLTRTGNLLGSPSYLAPEQARGEAAGPATDMWSLGTTLYAAVHGSPPFQRSTPMATLTAVVVDDVPPPLKAGPLRPLLEELLDKDPEGRPTVHEAAETLQQIVMEAPRGALAAPEPPVRAERTMTIPVGSVAAEPEVSENTDSLPVLPPGKGRGGGGLGLLALTGLAVLVVAAVIAAVVLLVPPAGGADPGGSDPGGAEPSTGAVPEESRSAVESAPESSAPPEPSPEGEEADDDEEEDDYSGPPLDRHEDSTGFSLDVPEDWDVDREGSSVFFRNPDGGYLQVDQTDSPGPDAKADWEVQEQGAGGRFPNYDLIGIEDVDDASMDRYATAADWEFTFTSGDREMHAVNRGFHTEEKGYALFLVYPEDDWEDTGAEILDRMSESFEPAA
ncbi:protein kinase domain-containing protein [Actinorugispora endophytica]|uniref:non-specific serine/threonine protein kinase n=1 Tax=Actinorugispora endophytica TaxID=1605990 RepID=A0A4R6UZN6_9ACTN|nr:serine/threonine-protein kinase [Actinorugispora endophytica]TDQ53076.1 serine/threonine protein kinase [Actinorugispora endophytica]